MKRRRNAKLKANYIVVTETHVLWIFNLDYDDDDDPWTRLYLPSPSHNDTKKRRQLCHFWSRTFWWWWLLVASQLFPLLLISFLVQKSLPHKQQKKVNHFSLFADAPLIWIILRTKKTHKWWTRAFHTAQFINYYCEHSTVLSVVLINIKVAGRRVKIAPTPRHQPTRK